MSKTSSVITIEMIDQLYMQVTTEGFGLTNYITEIPIKFTELVSSVKGFVDNTLVHRFANTTETNAYMLRQTLERTTYVNLSKLEIYVPPGLSVPFLEYANVLQKHSNVITDLSNKILMPGIRWANGYIREPSRLVSVRDFYAESGMEKIDVKSAKVDIARCTSGGQSLNRLPFNKVASNFNDYVESVKIINELCKTMESINNTDLIEKVDTFAKIIDTLNDKVEIGDERFKFPKSTIIQLADTIHHIAETVELYSGMVAYINAASVSIKHTEQLLRSALG